MKHNYQIVIEYDGTKFVGWQFQKNGTSIQEVLEQKLKKVLKNKIRVIGAGRTIPICNFIFIYPFFCAVS